MICVQIKRKIIYIIDKSPTMNECHSSNGIRLGTFSIDVLNPLIH